MRAHCLRTSLSSSTVGNFLEIAAVVRCHRLRLLLYLTASYRLPHRCSRRPLVLTGLRLLIRAFLLPHVSHILNSQTAKDLPILWCIRSPNSTGFLFWKSRVVTVVAEGPPSTAPFLVFSTSVVIRVGCACFTFRLLSELAHGTSGAYGDGGL